MTDKTDSFDARALIAAGAAFGLMLAAAGQARALDEVSFATNWKAQAEHGGFYQSVADGTYEEYGLDVTIVPGGPQANNRLLMVSGRVEFHMGGNLLQAFDAVKNDLPVIVVAAIFQKEPQVILSHPGVADTWESLKDLELLIGDNGYLSYYQWMKSEFGFTSEQRRPYTFNPAPFLANKNSGMQGYLSSEPYAVEREAGFKPNVFLIADYGFSTYSTTIETRPELVENNPDLVQRFVDASIIGWYNFLYGDNAAARELIKADNPEMTDDKIDFAIQAMIDNGIVDSGDTLELGIGAMTEARFKDFFDKMVAAGVTEADVDYTQSYTLDFVNKGVGMELRP